LCLSSHENHRHDVKLIHRFLLKICINDVYLAVVLKFAAKCRNSVKKSSKHSSNLIILTFTPGNKSVRKKFQNFISTNVGVLIRNLVGIFVLLPCVHLFLFVLVVFAVLVVLVHY